MEEELVSHIALAALASSIITELLKVFPKLSETDERKRLVSFVVCLLVSAVYYFSSGMTFEPLSFLTGVLASSFIIFKSIIQPVGSARNEVLSIIRGLRKKEEPQNEPQKES